jgi:hypothetical protein
VDSAGNTVFATYLGGPTADNAATLAVDTAGEVFVAGTTGGSFPTTANAALVTIPASGTFVAKLNANGSKMIYSTYLPASMATVSAMALDPDGNVYVTGTSSTGHVAVVKLSPDGSAFIYYQELAGSGQDAGTAIAVDAGGNAAIAGSTTSADFPVSGRRAAAAPAGSAKCICGGVGYRRKRGVLDIPGRFRLGRRVQRPD